MKRITSLLLAGMLCIGGIPALGEDLALTVFEALWSEDTARIQELYDRLDATVKGQITVETLTALKGQMIQAYGPWQKNGQVETQAGEGFTVYLLPVYLERQALQMQVVVMEETIVGLAFLPLQEKTEEAPYALPQGIVEKEIVVGEGGDYPLPGTLTMPHEGSDLPLAVLVHGSGPNDRNETAGQTHLFRDLAHALALEGIASIRYDKRTYVYGASMTAEQVQQLTVREETIQDAILAAEMARTLEGIDGERIYLVGHSMGAMMAPRIAHESSGAFAGLVLLSGTPKTLLQVIIDQNQALVDTLEGDLKIQQQAMLDAMTAEAEKTLALPADELKQKTVFGQPAYYFYEMNQYDAAALLQESGLPALIINGGKDFQIPDASGIKAWKDALGDDENVEMIHAPELNHVLMVYEGDPALQGSVREYETPARLDQKIAETITGWILGQ